MAASAHRIRTEYIDPRVTCYKTHTYRPRTMFRLPGMLTIWLSVTLLAVAPAFPYKKLMLSVASISIAAPAGLGSFCRWSACGAVTSLH